MPMSITKSVGKGGVNLKNDVMVVQALLNKVGAPSGGPAPALMVDGLCGMKTTTAIRTFQLRWFGPAGADSRVDPNGRTLARLNDFDTSDAPLTTVSVMQCPHGGQVKVVPSGPPPAGPLPNGAMPLKYTDGGAVSGCSFPLPCVKVKWLPGPTLTLNANSVGLCLNAANVPQGSVLIVTV